jgi:hypothetical protein
MIRGKESQKWDQKMALPSVDFDPVFQFSRFPVVAISVFIGF